MMYFALYTKPGKDLETARALHETGVLAFSPVSLVQGKSRGKSRKPVMHERVMIPRVVFAAFTEEQYAHARMPHVVAKVTITAGHQWGSVMKFVKDAQSAADRIRWQISSGEAVQHYKPGDLLEVLSGPLRGRIATFVKSIDGSSDLDLRIRAELDMFGSSVGCDLDPLAVKKAE